MAEQKVVELKLIADTSGANKSFKDIKDRISEAKLEASGFKDKIQEVGSNSNALDAIKKGAFELIPGLKGATEASSGLLIKMYELVANPIGLVITGIVVALKFLYEAFQSSIAGGKELKAIFAGLDGVLTQAKDAVFGLGRAFIDLVAAGYKFITLDFSGAMESFNDATKEAKTSMKQLGDATSTTYKRFYELEKAQQANDKARKIAAVEESKNNKLLVQSRDILTDETASIREKKKALEEVTKSETATAAERVRIAKQDLKINQEKQKVLGGEAAKKLKQEERDLQVALNDAEAEGARNGIKLNRQRKLLNRQQNADAKEAEAERDRIKKEADAALKEAEKVLMDNAISLADERDKELLTRANKYNEDVAKLKKAGITDLTVLEESYKKDTLAINKKYDDELEKKRIEKAQKDFAALQSETQGLIDESNRQIKKITDKDLEKASNEKLTFEERYAAVAEREGLVNEIIFKSEEEKTAFEKQNAEARKKISKDEKDAKESHLKSYLNAASAVADLLGKQTAEGKAIAIAVSLISTYSAIAKQLEAFSGVPIPGYAIAEALATGIVGFQQVAGIAAVDIPGGSGAGGGANSTPNGGSAQAPSFNVVGNTSATGNQLAKTLGDKAPLKAYVVSQDITTQQALDRNIVKTSSLG